MSISGGPEMTFRWIEAHLVGKFVTLMQVINKPNKYGLHFLTDLVSTIELLYFFHRFRRYLGRIPKNRHAPCTYLYYTRFKQGGSAYFSFNLFHLSKVW